MHAYTCVLVALPLPRHGESATADLAASYAGLNIPFLAIEGVRTHASVISTGALAVFRAFGRPPDRSRARVAASACLPLQDAPDLLPAHLMLTFKS